MNLTGLLLVSFIVATAAAGITPNVRIISVDGKAYTADVLRNAITEAEKSRQPIELPFRRGDEYTSVSFPYDSGLRVPSLKRIEGTPDRIDDILAPRKRALPGK